MCSFRNGRDSVKTNKNNTVAVTVSASHLFLPTFRWLSSGLVWQAELAVSGKEHCWQPLSWPPLQKVKPELSVVYKDSYSVEIKSKWGVSGLRAVFHHKVQRADVTCDVIKKFALFVLSKLWILVADWSICWSRDTFLMKLRLYQHSTHSARTKSMKSTPGMKFFWTIGTLANTGAGCCSVRCWLLLDRVEC